MRRLALALLAAAFAGCVTTEGAPEDAPRAVDADSLLLYLSDEGFELVPVGLTSIATPPTSGTRYRLAGPTTDAEVVVYQFREQDDVERGLAALKRGGAIRPVRRIYSRGRLAVSLVGSLPTLERALRRALGEPAVV